MRIALCGLFIAANTSIAMTGDPEATLTLNQLLQQQNSQQLSPRGSLKKSSDIVIDPLSLTSTPTTGSPRTSQNNSPRNEFVFPSFDLTGTGSPKESPQASPKLSPREQFNVITGGSQNNSPRDKIAAQFQITAYFTNTPDLNLQWYTCVNSKKTIDGLDELTYKDDANNLRTILYTTDKQWNNENYIAIFETTQGVTQNYVIDLRYEKTPSDTEHKNPKLSGVLTSNFDNMPKNITVYQGNITRIDHKNMTCQIIYVDDNDKIINVNVDCTSTPENPTYAIIKEDNVFKCVIKLPEQQNVTSQQAPVRKKFTPQIRRDSTYSVKTAIGATFLTVCIILAAYKYNKLPDVFAKLLDGLAAQCNNLIPSRFIR